jgi:hypothetical protein
VENAEDFVEMNQLNVNGGETPLLSHERLRVQARQGAAIGKKKGWRVAPGWFQCRKLYDCSSGTIPRGIRLAIPLPS